MFFLTRLFSGQSLRTLLIISAFTVLAAGIWFLGPFWGFGKVRPMEPVEARVLCISLAFFICFSLFWWRLPFFIMMGVTLCFAVWIMGPYVLLNKGYPLLVVSHRLMLIFAIIFIMMLYSLWKLLIALSHNPALFDKLLKFRATSPVPDADFYEINQIIKKAALWARKARRKIPTWKLFFLPESSRDQLPWFMFMGITGSGKTALITSSGQEFPVFEQLNRVGKESEPTAHCECWYSNDALFIDTSGKYVTDNDSSCKEWSGIIQAIRKYRPVKAINGTIVTLSCEDILAKDKGELFTFGALLRSRLDDVRTELGIQFPVYVVLTKMDCLTGFDEYFRSLTAQEREQIWGVSFPFGDKDTHASGSSLKEQIACELKLLEQRIDGYIAIRQQEEYASADRKTMYALAHDFGVLCETLTELLQGVFFASRYDHNQAGNILRGIYFTSSNQSGNKALNNNYTIIHRWQNFIEGKSPIAPSSQIAKKSTEDLSLVETSWNKHYFIKQLFSQVIIADAGLVSYNLKAESKYRFQNVFGHVLTLIVAFFLYTGITTSFQNNTQYLDAFDLKLGKLETAFAGFIKNAQQATVLPLLNQVRTLPDYEGLELFQPPWSWRYGMYVGKASTRNSNGLYQYMLCKFLYPVLVEHAHDALEEAVGSKENTRIYEALKLYLILTGEGHFDQKTSISAIKRQWEASGKTLPFEEDVLFIAHLNQLFSNEEWRQSLAPADNALIMLARSLLSQTTSANRLYDRVKSELLNDAPENLTLEKMTGNQSVQVLALNDENLVEQEIPGLYTWEGYHDVVKKKLALLLTAYQQEDSWVMGKSANLTLNPLALKSDVLTLYLKEYREIWKQFLANIRLVSAGPDFKDSASGLSGDIYLLRTLASSDTPLVALGREAVRQTSLAVEPAKLPNLMGTPGSSSPVVSKAWQMNMALEQRERKLVANNVDDYFSSLRDFVGAGPTSQAGPFSKMMSMLNEQYTLLVISSNALRDGDVPKMSDSGKQLAAESQTWPDPFQKIVEPLLNGVYEKMDYAVVNKSKETIESGLGEVCRSTLQGRYPFADSEQSVNISDFERFFAANGLVDDYFAKHLADKVDTSAMPWRYKGSSSSEGLAIFQQAAEIRNAFFQGQDGKKLMLNLSATVPYMDPSITQLKLSIDGVSLRYAHGPVMATSFKWPSASGESAIIFTVQPRIYTKNAGLKLEDAWALLRWVESAQEVSKSASGNDILTWYLDKRRVDVEVSGLRYGHRPIIELLRRFNCPTGL